MIIYAYSKIIMIDALSDLSKFEIDGKRKTAQIVISERL